MTLAPLRLDDLTWEEMVEAIRRRIPAESAEPGRCTPRSTRASRCWSCSPTCSSSGCTGWTRCRTRSCSPCSGCSAWTIRGPPAPPPPCCGSPRLPGEPGRADGAGGHRVRPGPAQQVVFTLDGPMTVLPVTTPPAVGGRPGTHRGPAAGRGVALLPADGGPGEARISLALTAPVPGGQLSLLIDLASPESRHPTTPRRPGCRPPTACRRQPTSPGPYADADPGTDRCGPGRRRHRGAAPLRGSPAAGPGVLERRAPGCDHCG